MHLRVRSNIIVACEKMQLVVTRNLAVNNWIALAQDLLTSPPVEVNALGHCIACAIRRLALTCLACLSTRKTSHLGPFSRSALGPPKVPYHAYIVKGHNLETIVLDIDTTAQYSLLRYYYDGVFIYSRI